MTKSEWVAKEVHNLANFLREDETLPPHLRDQERLPQQEWRRVFNAWEEGFFPISSEDSTLSLSDVSTWDSQLSLFPTTGGQLPLPFKLE